MNKLSQRKQFRVELSNSAKKAEKWGFKNFVRAGASGMMYDFFLYQGASTSADGKKCTGSYWLCSLQLCLQLKSMGFLVTAALRADRVKNAPCHQKKS